EAFKRYARKPGVMDSGMEALVADIRTYADYFCAMVLDSEKDKILKMAFQDLRELKVDAAWPFLLVLYHDYKQGILSAADFLSATRLIESYIFR
ncbi:hypothetical protein AAIH42_36210, partial [Pseudomonas aeruginosa]